MTSSSEIRSKFLEFFKQEMHTEIASSPIIPQDDPTLLFANAGMNQFKDFFTGQANPENKRAVTIQKCVRAGGKHNDLENVGFTARHHTFFEMLGNFSFGDYFKSEAISFAWKFLTKELKLPSDKLYITVHQSDEEARQIWHKEQGVPLDRIFFRDDKENFWEMGEVGPCGPCSEIFYDHGSEFSDGSDTTECILDDEGRYVEIWNLVFMQFEKYKNAEGEIERKPLPNPSVDTGAGLERLTAVLQGVYWNYDTDIFAPLIKQVEMLTRTSYSNEKHANSIRVVCDHVRAATMLITDGVIPSNEGRGYVLRRIIRRATRYLDELGANEPYLFKMVDTVFESLTNNYPQNQANRDLAVKLLKVEEEKFRTTLKNGLDLLKKEIESLKSNEFSGHIAFKLYDTFGFPFDLTQLILKEQNISLDVDGFHKAMADQKSKSRSASKFAAEDGGKEKFYQLYEEHGNTNFSGYTSLRQTAKLLAIIEDIKGHDNCVGLVFDSTPFYAESGGQVGDSGILCVNGDKFGEVIDTQKPVENLHVHITKPIQSVSVGEEYELVVDRERRQLIARNHSATHLLQSALIKVLGKHVKQAGSRVDESGLRFDFTQPEAVSKDQLKTIEAEVNRQIFKSLPVVASNMSQEEATSKGAMALFGEKYGDTVRVLEMGSYSLELCGGTHIQNTGDIGLFTILSESSLSSGVRRIEARSSHGALAHLIDRSHTLGNIERELSSNTDQVMDKILSLQNTIKQKNKEIKELSLKISQSNSTDLTQTLEKLENGVSWTAFNAEEVGPKDFKTMSDSFVDRDKEAILLLYNNKDGKFSYLLRTHKENKKIDCSKLIKAAQTLVEGRGGGRADMAQGSGKPEKMNEFIAFIKTQLGQI